MKKKKLAIFGTFIFLTCVAVFLLSASTKNSNAELTDEQVNNLRAEYPICYGTPPTVEMITPTLDQVIRIADTFVYGKVIGEAHHYYVELDGENEILKEKSKQNGLSNMCEFTGYTLEVISDTQDIINKPQISIIMNSLFDDYSPVLKDGMKVVAPASIDSEDGSRYSYMEYGFYYVTEDGYILSAFEEDAPTKKSGIQVVSLMKQLKQKKDDILNQQKND